jgi:phosphatidylglycerol:prolipoprotein diacylglycerol transferase
MALGLTVGMIFGRVGCYAVGEHLGGPTGFFLATRYEGGETREGPLQVGEAIHNTSLYEMLHLLALAALLWWIVARLPGRFPPGFALAIFCLWYGAARLGTDALRTYDDRTLGLTGAQWMCVALLAAGIALLARTRRVKHQAEPHPTQ